MRGIYLHIPFCKRKCSYCDFYSVETSSHTKNEFPDLLAREMDLFRDRFPEDARAAADTVYFGGGTPTVLAPEALCGLLATIRDRFPVAPGAEVTAETNPGTVSTEDLRTLRKGGFTRISVGVQSFSPTILRTLGRIHGVEDARKTIRDARSTGFDSLGIDLIFGIPGQTCTDWEEDLERTVASLPDHVSAYALAPETGTPLHASLSRGELKMPPDDEVAEMYKTARRALANAGYRQYEISNFARPGHESRHNVKYWKRDGVTGFGPSAHGLLFPPGRAPHGLRTATPPSLAEYRKGIREGRLPWADTLVCGPEEAWKEALIFGLRMTEGVDLTEIETISGSPLPDPLREAVNELVDGGKLLREEGRLRLPGELLFVSNEVLQRLA
ncbi:MAG: radical SAM family heme chaperone HemW [Candidatus Deferrimicrobiaceae bacterium]